MIELDRRLFPMLSSYMASFQRYVEDTIAYVKTDDINHGSSIQNSLHGNTSFYLQAKN